MQIEEVIAIDKTLTLITPNVRKDKYYLTYSLYRCSCGKEKVMRDSPIKLGYTKSCGCLNDELNIEKGKVLNAKYSHLNKTHGMIHSREYRSWGAMMNRCNNPNAEKYHRYGARDISVCPQWYSFEQFYSDMGDRPMEKTLYRINNDGNYEPNNCKWSTPKEQSNNRNNTKDAGWKG